MTTTSDRPAGQLPRSPAGLWALEAQKLDHGWKQQQGACPACGQSWRPDGTRPHTAGCPYIAWKRRA